MQKELFVLHCTWQNTIVMSQLHSTHFPSYKYLEGTRFPLLLAILVGTYHFGWSQHTKLTFPPNRRERESESSPQEVGTLPETPTAVPL